MGEKWPLLTISFFSISKAACLWLINMEGYNDRASGNMNLPSVATDTKRESLLYTACMGGQKDVVTALLERRADPTVIEEKSGDTPLHAVVCGEHGLELGPLLLAQGADINAFSGRGFTPLHMAAFHGSLPCCQMLLAHNADPTRVRHRFRKDRHRFSIGRFRPKTQTEPMQNRRFLTRRTGELARATSSMMLAQPPPLSNW